MTIAITIHLFKQFTLAMVILGDFERSDSKLPSYISVMINGHYIYFYKNKYNKLPPMLLIHLFWSPHASKGE